MDIKTFDAFNEKVRTFDWDYAYSDDHRVWRKGQDNIVNIRSEANKNPIFKEILFAWSRFMNGNRDANARAELDVTIAALRAKIEEPQ